MGDHRRLAFVGLAAWVLFWGASFVLGAMRPGYSHVVNEISELGAIGTPHAVYWNVFGFMLPGLLIAISGAAIARAVSPGGSRVGLVATICLTLTGLAIAGQGLMPAAMVDGRVDITSLSTRGHFVSSLLTGLAWLAGALMLLAPMKRDPRWRAMRPISMVLIVLALVASFTLRGVLPPGLAQRTGNLIVCLWFVTMSMRMLSLSKV